MTKSAFKYSIVLVFFITFLTYFFDLSNLNGLRQGTEGFYLQISKEMFERGSILTPFYRGALHWSKPFLHFVLPFPLYITSLFSTVHAARLSIAILTIFIVFLSSRIISRRTSISAISIFVFFLCCVGFIKYSRTFMMEIPLSLLTFLGSLYFYEFLSTNTKKNLLLCVLFLSASVLIKGPVSLVLSFLSISLYFVLSTILYKHNILKRRILIVFTLSFLLSSIWFISTYYRYGMEFFNYFFLRENVGKFNTISYPMSHVFQGLFLFSLPWSLLFPRLVFESFKQKESFKNLITNDYFIFAISHAIVFFVVWLVPTQRSHHYAMPSIPFFLMTILIMLKEYDIKSYSILRYGLVTFSILILILTVFSISNLKALEIIGLNSYYLYLSLTVFVFIAVFSLRSNSLYSLGIAFMCFFGWIWVFYAPIFIPEQFPQTAIDIAADKTVVGFVNKPFFIEEALNRKMVVLPARELFKNINETDVYLLTKDDYDFHRGGSVCKIEYEWKIWKKRTKIKQVFDALSTGNYESIRTKYVLFTCLANP